MKEADLQKGVIDAAEAFGWRVFHVRDSRKVLQTHTSPGFPDLVLAHGDWGHAFVELKGVRTPVSPDQFLWLDILAKVHKCVALWRPKHYDAALAWLENPIGQPFPGRWAE